MIKFSSLRINGPVRKLIFIALCGLLNVTALAQGDFRSGYLIKNNNDSIPGLVDYRVGKKAYQQCIFKEQKNGNKQRFSPEELKAYGFVNDKRYESKPASVKEDKKEKVFMEVLVKGKMSLYSYREVYYVMIDSLMELPKNERRVVKTDAGPRLQENRKYIGILNFLISECDLTANEIKYDQRALTYLVQNYNRCKGNLGWAYKENLPWTRFEGQLFTGFSSSNLKVDGFDSDAFGVSQTIFGGAELDVSSPRINSKLFLSIEAWYIRNLYQGYTMNQESTGYTNNDYIINASFLKMPIGVRYNFVKDNQTPYIKFGYVHQFKLSSNMKIVSEHVVNNVVVTTVDNRTWDGKNQFGFWLGVGYSKGIARKYKIFSEVRYEKTNGFLGTAIQPESNITNFQLILGLRF